MFPPVVFFYPFHCIETMTNINNDNTYITIIGLALYSDLTLFCLYALLLFFLYYIKNAVCIFYFFISGINMLINPHNRLCNNEITHQMDFHPMSSLLMVVILSFAMI